MKKLRVFLGISVLVVAIVVISGKVLLAQPEAKKICFYNKVNGSSEIKLEDLNPSEAKCIDDTERLNVFNSAKTSVLKFKMWRAGMMGTFTDKENKEHLIRISFTEGYIVDVTSHKTYTIEDPAVRDKWYQIVNAHFNDRD